MTTTPPFDDALISLALVRTTEAAALAAARLAGQGDEEAADTAALNAMAAALAVQPFRGRIVVGEGCRHTAPALFTDDEVGAGSGPVVDVALDPLEGATLTAKDMPGAISVIAVGAEGSMLRVPDIYMEKLAIGPGYPEGLVSLDMPPAERVRKLASAKGCRPEEITVCVLERPRHRALVEALREAGARVRFITDGDVAGVIHVADPEETGVDIYMGSGGAPEGVLAAAALKCLGGQFEGRLVLRSESDRQTAIEKGIDDPTRSWLRDELVRGDVVFSASGVTDSPLVGGVHRRRGWCECETLLMRSATGSIRRIHYRRRETGGEAGIHPEIG